MTRKGAAERERAEAQESTETSERAEKRECAEKAERAVIPESVADEERADEVESAVRSERADELESAERKERAELVESTDVAERASASESAEDSERAEPSESAEVGERPAYVLGYPHIEVPTHALWEAQQAGWPNHLPQEAWQAIISLHNAQKPVKASSADHPAFQPDYAPNYLATQELPPEPPEPLAGTKARR